MARTREQNDLLAKLRFAEGMRPKKPAKKVKTPPQQNHHVKAYRKATSGRRGTVENHPLYACWKGMIRRCYNSLDAAYNWYGAKGVRVCPEWKADFWRFVADMGERPEFHTLDRIDVNGHYCKANCRWASLIDQANNRRDTVYITMSLREWAETLDLPIAQVRYMYDKGRLNKKV